MTSRIPGHVWVPRWIVELGQPELKCARLGHRPTTERWQGYQWPARDPFGAVADMIEQERPVCRRCGVTLGSWKVVARTPLQGMTMNADDFHALRRDGFLRR